MALQLILAFEHRVIPSGLGDTSGLKGLSTSCALIFRSVCFSSSLAIAHPAVYTEKGRGFCTYRVLS